MQSLLILCYIPVRLLFATSSLAQSTGTHSDTVIGTALRRACGASCTRFFLTLKITLNI